MAADPYRHGTSCMNCTAGRAGVDGICNACPPGMEPNRGSTSCDICWYDTFSTNGVSCNRCPPNTDTRKMSEQDNVGDCLCEDGTYDSFVTAGMLECYNERAQITDTVDPDFAAQTQCYDCPACFSCAEKFDSSAPTPGAGYWRPAVTDMYLLKCTNGGACLGGVDSDCAPEYRGLLCGSCALGYQPESALRGVCTACPDQFWSTVYVSIGGVVIYAVAAIVIQKTHDAAVPPNIQSILKPGDDNSETLVGCLRIVLGFLQVQSMVSDFPMHWPKTLTFLFQGAGILSDPYFIARNTWCLRRTEADTEVYMRSLFIMVSPFVLALGVGLIYLWQHFIYIGCKADPSLYYAEAAKATASNAVVTFDENKDGEVTTDEVTKVLDLDKNGKVSKSEFKEWWKRHKKDVSVQQRS